MAKRFGRPRHVETALALPTAPNEPSDNLEDYCVLIFGRKSVGKSTLASSWPDALNFQCEPGRRNLRIMMVPREPKEKLTWKSFLEYGRLFAETDHFHSAVVDTVDRAYNLCYTSVCSQWGVSQPSDAGYDSSSLWNAIKQEFEIGLELLRSSGKSLILVSHDRTTKRENRDGTYLDRLEPTCPGQALNVCQAICDFVFCYDFSNNDRVLTVRDFENNSWASCGLDTAFLDPDGTPLHRILIPHFKSNTTSQIWNLLQSAFQGELRDYDYTPPRKKPLGKPKFKKKVKR